MSSGNCHEITFQKRTIAASFLSPEGTPVENRIEIRTNPVTGRTARISLARSLETEPGTDILPPPPPDAFDTKNCPFCAPLVFRKTPTLHPDLAREGRLKYKDSILFPNLFPYGCHSAVSLFGADHFVEIGTATLESYTDCFINCGRYLERVKKYDPKAVFMAITQNHLPSAGGSLVHPHLQIQADRIGANHHRFLCQKAMDYEKRTGRTVFSDLLALERKDGDRYVGKTGAWEWFAAYAPEGFYELWAILPGRFSVLEIGDAEWRHLSRGVLNAQKLYRSLNRNGYNLGLLSVESPENRCLELRCVVLARSNYAKWVRNDHTGFEVMLGDMTTFSSPEDTAALAGKFWE